MKDIKSFLSNLDRKEMTNTQRVLVQLLQAGGSWISRNQLRAPHATSRIRDLRTKDFGSFKVECATAAELQKRASEGRPTFYRLDPSTVTQKQLNRVFEGVISTSSR